MGNDLRVKEATHSSRKREYAFYDGMNFYASHLSDFVIQPNWTDSLNAIIYVNFIS